VLIAWGDPVSNGPAFQQDASNSAAEQAQQWGMHNDGLVYFPIEGSNRGLLVQNNEYTDDGLLFPDGVNNWSTEKTNKSLNAHGVSIVEIIKNGATGNQAGEWRVVRPSNFARRITGQTAIDIGGPAAGDPKLRTSADPTGRLVLGTLNNCAMGFTPWGTYLACEENFNGYFYTERAPNIPNQGDPEERTSIEKRYGISPFGSGFRFYTTHPRFNADTEPNEPNRFGWGSRNRSFRRPPPP
jgi:secreted PhoX family phosphatase